MKKTDIIADIFTYSNTWDNYSVSVIYFHIVSKVILQFSLGQGFMVRFLNLLLQNLQPDPSTRICVYEIAEEYDTLFMQYYYWDFVSELNDNHLQKLYECL
jgi:hypothetical protein